MLTDEVSWESFFESHGGRVPDNGTNHVYSIGKHRSDTVDGTPYDGFAFYLSSCVITWMTAPGKVINTVLASHGAMYTVSDANDHIERTWYTTCDRLWQTMFFYIILLRPSLTFFQISLGIWLEILLDLWQLNIVKQNRCVCSNKQQHHFVAFSFLCGEIVLCSLQIYI